MPLSTVAQSATRAAIALAGQPVTFQRVTGVAPNATLTPANGASVTAVVRDYVLDTTADAQAGYSASQPGAITQGDRLFIVMAADLAAAGFPVPVQKGDQILIAASGELLSVVRVDAGKRYLAGAVEIFAAGVA